jgi:hypothetical protein
MAVVGEAQIIVRAITTGVADEISRGIKAASSDVEREGRRSGTSFLGGISKAFDGAKADSVFGDIFNPDKAEATRQGWVSLQKQGFNLQTIVGTLAGSIGSLVGALGSLVGSAGAAAPALVAVGGAAIGAGIGMKLAGMALEGVTGPLNQVGKSARGTTKTIAELREEMQQLRFDSEEAALSEKEAALNLEKARETLARVQDLPPNSMARREAELSFEQADLALRRAIDRNNDLKEEIENGPKQAAGAGADPYQGLTESQKVFARLLVGLKPKFDALKEAVAKGFLPLLGSQINTLFNKNFPTLERMFSGIGVALGNATGFVFDFINSSRGMKLFESLFKNSEGVIEDLGETLALVLEYVLIILEAAAPITKEFSGWLKDSAKNFRDLVSGAAANGDLAQFFKDSARIAKDFGTVLDNIFNGFGDLIADSFQPGSGGDILLQWLKDATAGFAAIGDDASGLRTFLQGTATNTVAIFKSIGALFKEIIALGDMPELKEFWDRLGEGAPYVGEILENGIKAGPALANLVVQITKIVAAFADSGAPIAFFETLGTVTKAIADFLSIKQVKDFLDSIAPLQGFFLAIGTITTAIATGLGLVFGISLFIAKQFMRVVKIVKVLISVFKFLFTLIKVIGLAIRFAFVANPIGLIITAVTALIAGLVFFFTQTELGKEIWQGFVDFIIIALKAIGDFFVSVWEGIVSFFKPVIDIIVAYYTKAFEIMGAILQVIGAIFTVIFVLIATVVQAVWDRIRGGFQALSDFLLPVVSAIGDFFTTVFGAIGGFISGVWDNITKGFQAFVNFIKPAIGAIFGFFKTVFDNIVGFYKGVINTMIGFAEGFVNFFIMGLNWIIGKINEIKLDVPEVLQPLVGGAKTIGFDIAKVGELKLPRLAKGGVVSPSMGGSLVNVAEAGRPERIEPLDENGMSKRDKAMIAALSSGGGRGVNITVNPSPGMNETELANIVSRQLAFQLRAGGI